MTTHVNLKIIEGFLIKGHDNLSNLNSPHGTTAVIPFGETKSINL